MNTPVSLDVPRRVHLVGDTRPEDLVFDSVALTQAAASVLGELTAMTRPGKTGARPADHSQHRHQFTA